MTAENTLAKFGLSALQAPKNTPPSITDVDVTSLTNDELTKLYVMHVGFAAYIATLVTQAETSFTEAVAARDYFMAKRKIELREEDPDVSEDEFTKIIKSQIEYLDLSAEVTKRKNERTLLKGFYSNYKSQAAALSRVASIRSTDLAQAQSLNHRRPRSSFAPRVAALGKPATEEEDDDDDDDDEIELELGDD